MVKKQKGSVMRIRALLAALCCVAGLVFVTGCDSPEKGFKEWQKAIVKGDVAAAKARTAKGAREYIHVLVEEIRNDAGKKKDLENTKVVSCTRNGDTAVLTLKDGKGQEDKIKMVQEDGEWKVKDVK